MILRLLPVLIACLLAQSSLAHGEGAATFTIFTNQFAGPPIVGYGAEMSPFLTAPNADQPVGDLADLEQKFKTLAPQHTRIYLLAEWWQPGHEKQRDSFIRTCQMAQAVGATINVTLWTGWDAEPARYSSELAAILKDLIVNRSLSAVRYVTIQNEVNSTKITMQQYNEFYRLFDRDLRQAGIRDKIQIVGGDLVRNHQAEWLRDLTTELASVCDGHSIHIYWDYPDVEDAIQRLRKIAAVPKKLPVEGRRPLYITEFGVRGDDRQGPGKDPGVYKDGTPITQTATAALQDGWLMTEATRLGFVATVQWEAYDMAYGKHPMHYGIMGEPGEGWPLRPGYQVLRLFTHTISPGWRALQLEGDSTNVAVAVVQGPAGELTIIAVNHTAIAQPISIVNLPPGKKFHQIVWSAAEPNHLQSLADIIADAPFQMTLSWRSITTLSTQSFDQ